jgi:Arc/MetJ-type ribon-helix-helix transcriptional regulator
VSFDYGAPAELFLSKRIGRARVNYRRFATAAEAIRYAVEALPDLRKLGAQMQIGDERFNCDEIRRLYDDSDYPLKKASN